MASAGMAIVMPLSRVISPPATPMSTWWARRAWVPPSPQPKGDRARSVANEVDNLRITNINVFFGAASPTGVEPPLRFLDDQENLGSSNQQDTSDVGLHKPCIFAALRRRRDGARASWRGGGSKSRQ